MLWALLSREVMPKLAPAEAVCREVERARKAARRSGGLALGADRIKV